VESVRAGKYMEIRVDAPTKEKAEESVTEMCKKLLANPVIEEFSGGGCTGVISRRFCADFLRKVMCDGVRRQRPLVH